MAEEHPVTNGDGQFDVWRSRQLLLSNSTKRRISELHNIRSYLASEEHASTQKAAILRALFQTYPLYIDAGSRRAVEQCISAVAQSSDATQVLSGFVDDVQIESSKPGLAPANAYILARWSALLLQRIHEQQTWELWGLKMIGTLTNSLNTLMALHPRRSVLANALRSSQRAIRSLLLSPCGTLAIDSSIGFLTAKGPIPAPKNSLLLGIIAGACGLISGQRFHVESRKQDYIGFFLREILGSRAQLPPYLAEALKDFFRLYLSADDIKTEITPAVEKALLRAPEVVLKDILVSIVNGFPDDLDLSNIMAISLLKPLISNVKSTNAAIRSGVVLTFQAICRRSRENSFIEKAIDELLTPLKTNKVTAAEQRIVHAEMLSALSITPPLLEKLFQGLLVVVNKEVNESAAGAEINTITRCLRTALELRMHLETTTIDGICKGLAEKRLPIRRFWILQLADCIWTLDDETLDSPAACALMDSCVPKLIDAFNDVLASLMPSTQNGQISIAFVITTLCFSKIPLMTAMKNASIIKKAGIAEKAFTVEPKPSFLLSPRVYSKLTSEEDLRWFLRSIISAYPRLTTIADHGALTKLWAQAVIYISVSSNVPSSVRREALAALQSLFASDMAQISNTIINGLWQWCEDVEAEAKESAAIASKTGRTRLHLVVWAICPGVQKMPRLASSEAKNVTEEHVRGLLVLCQQQLIPQARWIDVCLHMGADPGELAANSSKDCLSQILFVTENPAWRDLPAFQKSAYYAMADLAFIAPDTFTPLIKAQISLDLDPNQVRAIGPTEVAIYRTPPGTAYEDVLSKQSEKPKLSKGDKNYDTLKWEEDLKAQIALRKGQTKKLNAEEQAKVNAQLSKESKIRADVAVVDAKMKRGIGIISALALGPPTEAVAWLGPSVGILLEAMQAGAGLLLGDAASLAYLQCSGKISPRLAPMQESLGIATLRAAGVSALPENLLTEPLKDLVTRVLYRLRFLGEQRPLDGVTLSYILPLIFIVLDAGGVGCAASEDADEQIVLALELLSFHAENFSDTRLPRRELSSALINAMDRYTQHFKLCKDCFMDICRCMAPSADEVETEAIVMKSIAADISVRKTVLQAISDELELTDRPFYPEIWLACHDDDEGNRAIASDIWEENELQVTTEAASQCLPFLGSKDPQARRAAARAIAAAVKETSSIFEEILSQLQESYLECAKPKKPELDRYGMPLKKDMSDPWETRQGISLSFKELAPIFPSHLLVPFMTFLIKDGPLSDNNTMVRDGMVEAATRVVSLRGGSQLEPLMKLCESTLQSSESTLQSYDLVNEAVVILYGSLARHLPNEDPRLPEVVSLLISTLSTPSESVQYAVAQCLPPLIRSSGNRAQQYLTGTVDETLHAKKYAARRGAAYGLAAIVKGQGISLLKETRLISTLRSATENKKDANERQGAFLAFELLSLLLGRVFEPYVIEIVPQLLVGFGDANADVREACLDASKTFFASLSSYGVKKILPTLLEGLDEQQWRSKKGACDSLGAMAYLDPQQLAVSLPQIIPPLTIVLNDSHKEVRASANRSLQRFGEVISNPEVKSQVDILLKALSDPTKYTDEALDALIKVNFIHYLDAPSLALVVRILERGLGDRSATKRKAAQIIGSLAHLTERKDLIVHLPILVAGLRIAIVDPVPTTRATASKALGSTMEKLGEDALPDLIPSLMSTLKSDSGAGDRLGSAQALSEVLAGLGTSRLEETLPSILQNVSSSKPSVREGFMSLFIFLPACFGNSFANYLAKIIPPILSGLADDVESIRETALRAGRLLVKNFSSRSVDLLLPELERGLADDSYRIRLSSVELVGDLLFNLTGISGKAEQEDEAEASANEAGQSLLETLGEDKRNRVLSALYICRCDTSGLVRSAAIGVWKALVSSPRTLRELVPTLTQFLVRRLASSNMEQKVIAGNALGELIRKAGEGVLTNLLPTLEEGLQTSTDSDARQGICIALRELISSASPDALQDYEKTLISIVRIALVDSDEDVREAAAEAFDSLQGVLGKRAVDQVLPHLLNLLRSEDDAENALSALLTLLTGSARANIILPNLLPTLLTSPISTFNARALASLAEVAGPSMTRRLPTILNALMDNAVACRNEDLRGELDASLDAVILSVDEFDGLNTMMSVMLGLVKNDDHRKRASADLHLAKFLETSEIDCSRYYPDLIRAMLIAFDDSDPEVVKAAWTGLNALTQRLRKEEMESLVISTRQSLNQVGVPGHALPGFSLPKGIGAVLPIFLQGLINGSAEPRTQAALAISDLIDRTSVEGLRPFITQITGPLIRVVSERSTDLKAAILLTLNNLLEKVPALLKPFLPQLQRTFAKSLADTSSEILRSRAAKALGTLITMSPRIDPLIAELVTGSKTPDPGVRNAMLKALYEVVSKAGGSMNEASKSSILGLIDSATGGADAALNITHAKLLGALIKVLPADTVAGLIRSRVLTQHLTNSSVLALNAVLVDSPAALTDSFDDTTRSTIVQGIEHSQPYISDNFVLAAGKYILGEAGSKGFEDLKPIMEALALAVEPGKPVDTRRLALVVLRTVSREHNDLVRPHLEIIAPKIFSCVRDPVIPIKLSAEAAFLSVFAVVDEDSAVFDKYLQASGANMSVAAKRSMQEYFKRVALKLSNQARERKEAEGGQGSLGLSSDERDDEKEVWSIGRVELNDGLFNDE